jgi:L-alanine-DL-glutamate epimerase-like enolase superfamily enzyme
LKITNISTRVVNARMRNWIFVKVETDRPGLYGWGEATLEWKTKAVVGAIQDLSQLLIGQDPRRVEHCWQIMHRQYFWRGGIINSSAMSGIDQSACGGISEARRIAAMAETYMISVACHNPQGPVSTMSCLQVGFATPNYLIQEVVRKDVPWRDDVVTEPVNMEGGVYHAPTAPGLGIDINETEAAKHPYEPEVPMAYFHKDGSVADW